MFKVNIPIFIIPCLVLVLLGCGDRVKSENSDDPEITKIVTTFFKEYQEKGTAKAVDYIFTANDNFKSEKKEEVKSKLLSFGFQAGPYYGYDKITKHTASGRLIYYSYLMRFEKQPLRIIFVFYKPNDKWQVYKFNFDDDLDTELEESGKIYMLE